jgi:hypothetical protein
LTLGEVEDVSTEDGAKDGTAVEFASNYSYKFSIVVMRNDVRVLAIVPTVYNWIDATLDNETVVGQPVTFGGLMWMDRNLGASTWDAENDFYGSIGYYYQYGRNIPYILDTTKWVIYADDNDVNDMVASSAYGYSVIKPILSTNTTERFWPWYAWNSHGKTPTEEEKEMLTRYQVECFYTYYSTGSLDTVQGVTYITGSKVQQPFRYVGQAIYNKDGTMNVEQTKNYYRFSVKGKSSSSTYNGWTYSENSALTYWSADVNDQPCPKGWRLPNRVDFYEFMPWTCNTTLSQGDYIKWTESWWKNARTTEPPKKLGISGDDYYHPGWYQDIYYGEITNTEDNSTYNVVYMLNRNAASGEDATSAYRIRIKTNFSKGITEEYKAKNQYSTNKRYITIDRYTADPKRDLSDYFDTKNKYNEKESDWDTPVESMIYPCAGYIVTDSYFDLRTFGTGSVLRTDEANIDADASSWVQYLSRSNMSVSVNSRSRRSLGDQVRCCRDLTATK